jgi:hypothetical protein
MVTIQSKKEMAKKYKMTIGFYGKITSYHTASSYKLLKNYGFEDKYIEPVIWYPKEKKVVRFKDAKKEHEIELIKLFKENNETTN